MATRPLASLTEQSLALSRRAATAALVAFPICWTGARAQPAGSRRPTPAQTEGPFYPVTLPKDSDHDLLRNGALQYGRGQPAWVEGQVTDLQGKPLAGGEVEIWQCDEAGHYHHPGDGARADPAFQGFGRVALGADGRYRFRTIRPVAYSGRTPHIHVKVKLGRRELLTTQLYVEGDPHNERDGLWRRLETADRAAVTVPFRPGTDGLLAQFPIVVAA
jgi:protocatechuate 3,4-dioxygenase beta subunit